jgi:glycosyltransferase involved in cell wall biosynthesis
MYRENRIAVIVPAYNEGRQIGQVIDSMPQIVDAIIVVNDCSTDNTKEVVARYAAAPNSKVILIDLAQNQGVGGAIAQGFKYARDLKFEIATVMDGDGQMDPNDLSRLLDPIVENSVDYSKGNRFMSGEAFQAMPKVRFFGNAALSMLTKIASGYWHIADSQSGYRAISKRALNAIDWDKSYKRYGQPNDLLVTLNILNFRVGDVSIKPLYGVGEVSTLKIHKAIFTIGWLLVRLFFKRLFMKYVIRDFHPLVFFYGIGILLLAITVPLSLRLILLTFLYDHVPKVNLILLNFSLLSGIQFVLFAMWFDMDFNKHLRPRKSFDSL